MKQNITKFDLNDAFKALDEIEIPVASKPRANRPVLNESLKPMAKTDCLFEDFYDINNPEDLNAAKEAREDEVAKAKLARIEKIVDLDADSPEDLLPSYVGKTIIQCPQCMTLFYKNPEDIEHSEDDPNTVNVGEVCQHCGNDQGYTVIGKVAAEEVPADEVNNKEVPAEEAPVEGGEEELTDESELDLNFEEPVEGGEKSEEAPVEETEEKSEEEAKEETSEEESKEEEKPEEEKKEEEEEEKKEESFSAPTGEVLTEAADDDLNKKLEAHNKYIKYLQDEIEAKQKALADEKNEEIKESIKDCIEALQQKLTDSLPDSLKAEKEVEDLPTPEEAEVSSENKEEEKVEEKEKTESLHESVESELSRFEASLDADLSEGCKKCNEDVDYVDDAETVLNNFEASLGESCEGKDCDKEDCKDGKCEESCEGKDCLKESDVQSILADFEAGLSESCKNCNEEEDQALAARQDPIKVEKTDLKESDVQSTIDAFVASLDADLHEDVNNELTEAEAENIGEIIGVDVPKATNAEFGRMINSPAFKMGESLIEEEDPEVNLDDVEFTEDYVVESEEPLPSGVVAAASEAEAKLKAIAAKGEKYIADKEAEEAEKEEYPNDVEELNDSYVNSTISNYLKEVYSNVKDFEATGCSYNNDKLIIEGTINFKSGKTKATEFKFNKVSTNVYEGVNEDLAKDGKFTLNCFREAGGKILMAESLAYKYTINNTLVEGLAKHNK